MLLVKVRENMCFSQGKGKYVFSQGKGKYVL